jgi:large subunit ribosomal protein L19
MYGTKEMQIIEKKTIRSDLPEFRPGDTVIVHANIKEGGKERIQLVEGVVLRRSGQGTTKTFTVRKISSGIGVEIIYPESSPAVTKIEVKARGTVRRAKLYYLRGLTGKAAKVKNKEGLGDDAAVVTQ